MGMCLHVSSSLPPSLSSLLLHLLPSLSILPPPSPPSLPPSAVSVPCPAHPTSVVGGSLSTYSCPTVDSASRDNPVINDMGVTRIFIHMFHVLHVYRSHLVSNLLLMTTDPPSDWPVRGQGTLIQTKACRVKRRVQGDQTAYTLNEVCVRARARVCVNV